MLLREYNTSNTNASLAAPGGEKASGKNYDNIITGKSKPYKNTEYETKYGKLYPNIAKIVRDIKSSAFKGDILLQAPAIAELQNLFKSYTPKQVSENEYTLPFGDNVRLKQQGNVLYITYNKSKDSQIQNITTLPIK